MGVQAGHFWKVVIHPVIVRVDGAEAGFRKAAVPFIQQNRCDCALMPAGFQRNPVVGERIAREMKLTNIVMYYDGDYDAYFAYDKYTVDIFGKLKGPEDIWLEGE